MTEAAVAGVGYFEADDREVRRPGWTYTADTLATFPADQRLTLVLGADAARGLPTWERADAVLARADVAVMARRGVDRAEVEAAAGRAVTWLDAPQVAISGTLLRARAAAGGSLRFLVPDPVWRYVVEHRLYADD